LVKDKTNPKKQVIGPYGFATSSLTRPIMISDYRKGIENNELKVNDLEEIAEMQTFVRNAKGKIEHEVGKKDDRVFGSMLAVQGIMNADRYY
jgi:hypothetical protein